MKWNYTASVTHCERFSPSGRTGLRAGTCRQAERVWKHCGRLTHWGKKMTIISSFFTYPPICKMCINITTLKLDSNWWLLNNSLYNNNTLPGGIFSLPKLLLLLRRVFHQWRSCRITLCTVYNLKIQLVEKVSHLFTNKFLSMSEAWQIKKNKVDLLLSNFSPFLPQSASCYNASGPDAVPSLGLFLSPSSHCPASSLPPFPPITVLLLILYFLLGTLGLSTRGSPPEHPSRREQVFLIHVICLIH